MGAAVKKIPSLGAFTPVESMLKGGSAKDVMNPMSLIRDTKTVLHNPSGVLNKQTLTGQGDTSNQSFTKAKEDAESQKQATQRSNWLNTYGDATTFRNRKDSGLQV